ncbi:MAG: aromatic amino acid ammonia-lyase [Syntrophales bacterium]|nr:aromatic amino acid ammonia-lyase [Syntrophales bacterium]
MIKKKAVVVGEGPVTLEQIVAVSEGKAAVRLSADESFIRRIEGARAMLTDAMQNGVAVYGANTGYGKSCGKRISVKAASKHVVSPIAFHGCGTGDLIGVAETRAAMLCRMICLAMGYSAVSMALLKQLEAFLNLGITPAVPSEGSVGASGDLTPMSYVAACLAGEREVLYRGKRMPALKALQAAKLSPYRFEPKEPLSMINGTSTMTGIAVMVVDRAERILDAFMCAAALSVHAFKGKVHHFHPLIGEVKPFAGQIHVAKRLRDLLATKHSSSEMEEHSPDSLQDPYSIRCTPQIAGVLYDALAWIRVWVETEANSSNDNPIFDPETGKPFMSGNFYGGHIAFAMDALKCALAAIADISDRQIILLVNPQTNRGLPADLVGAAGDRFLLNHGFKAMSITATALCAEALKGTMPAASFSRSCESHNQDKVSLGTIAARDAQRICTLVERIVAIHLLTAAQGCELRKDFQARPALSDVIKNIRVTADGVIEDRPMDRDIENIAEVIAKTDVFKPAVR